MKTFQTYLESRQYWRDKYAGWNMGSFEDVDYLLKRNWFTCEDEIEDLLWSVEDEVYWKIEQNRKRYPLRIRVHLESFLPDPEFMKLRVRDPDAPANNTQ
jgi:hypothetical protein